MVPINNLESVSRNPTLLQPFISLDDSPKIARKIHNNFSLLQNFRNVCKILHV